jgi:hypothetical protein
MANEITYNQCFLSLNQPICDTTNYLKENGVEEISTFDTFVDDEKNSVDVRETSEKISYFSLNKEYNEKKEEEQSVGVIKWNPSNGLKFKDYQGKEGRLSPSLVLLHEMGHAWDTKETGVFGITVKYNIPIKNYKNMAEEYVISNIENPAAEKLREGIRDYYGGGKVIKTISVRHTITEKEYKKQQKAKKR